jgi:serine/threonine protein kinase
VISEVDAFVLTRKGAYLIEIKSTPGRLTGDQQRWMFRRPDGGRTTMENPLLGINRKAKRIKSLLERRWSEVAGANASNRPPFIQPVVFLSDPNLDLGSVVVFDHHPDAVRLDHWLASTDDLDIDDRLSVLRQLAETMKAVHRRKVTHRSLSPDSVLVRPGASGEARWVVLVTDFSLAGRDHPASTAPTTGTRSGTRSGSRFGLPTAAPGDVALLADEAALLFCAPEVATEDDPDGVSLDVFSFGALAYQVLAGQPPGESRDAVRESLRAGRGLQLAAAVPGVADSLHNLVLEATRPLVSDRLTSFDDILAGLDLVEEELTAPTITTVDAEPVAEVDPRDAKPGDVLGDGTVVKRRLGRGSTAVALLVDRGEEATPRRVVYKVSLGGDADARLRAEAEVLAGLRHSAVVESIDLIDLAGRPVLVEAVAGSQSLSDELRRNGTPGIEFLERWGSDLLEAVRFLEREGRVHRDIKPDNLGVTEVGPNKEQHLVLFDFSLASARPADIGAGTPPYLEPFLADRNPKQWDLAAERYATAVTLHEMASGEV